MAKARKSVGYVPEGSDMAEIPFFLDGGLPCGLQKPTGYGMVDQYGLLPASMVIESVAKVSFKVMCMVV